MNVDSEIWALAGVFIGALLSFTASYLAERANWRRSQAVRWDERRLAIYADYGNAVKAVVNLSARIAAEIGLNPEADPLASPEENLAGLAQAEARRSTSSETFRLLADADTCAAGIRMTQCAANLNWLSRGVIQGDQELWKRNSGSTKSHGTSTWCAREGIYLFQENMSLRICLEFRCLIQPVGRAHIQVRRGHGKSRIIVRDKRS